MKFQPTSNNEVLTSSTKELMCGTYDNIFERSAL